MAKKEHVDIIRNDDFEAVSEDLAQAMEQLDAANGRIQDLLEGETMPIASGTDDEGDENEGGDEMNLAPDTTQEHSEQPS